MVWKEVSCNRLIILSYIGEIMIYRGRSSQCQKAMRTGVEGWIKCVGKVVGYCIVVGSEEISLNGKCQLWL